MSTLFWLTAAQMARLHPFFPKSHRRPHVDDLRVLSGSIFINRNGLRWLAVVRRSAGIWTCKILLQPLEALEVSGKRHWSERSREHGVFARIMVGLAFGGSWIRRDWLREALEDKGIKACIPGRKSREKPVKYDRRRYKRRNRIEIMFGRHKDRRRVATRLTTDALIAVRRSSAVCFWCWGCSSPGSASSGPCCLCFRPCSV